MLPEICLLIGSFALSNGTNPEQFEAFIEDVIGTWQLQSVTVIAVDDLPKLCMNHQWLLCLSNNQGQVRKRLFRKHHMDLYTKERFEMDEPYKK